MKPSERSEGGSRTNASLPVAGWALGGVSRTTKSFLNEQNRFRLFAAEDFLYISQIPLLWVVSGIRTLFVDCAGSARRGLRYNANNAIMSTVKSVFCNY